LPWPINTSEKLIYTINIIKINIEKKDMPARKQVITKTNAKKKGLLFCKYFKNASDINGIKVNPTMWAPSFDNSANSNLGGACAENGNTGSIVSMATKNAGKWRFVKT